MTANSCMGKGKPSLNANNYVISSAEDELSKICAEYLYSHLAKRSVGKSPIVKIVKNKATDVFDDFKHIHLEVDPDMKYDYRIDHTKERLHISVCNYETAQWITYQLIENIANADSRFNADDLPPSIINFDSHCKVFDFSYREPYFAPNLEDGYSSLIGTNNVERDWGLWGHSLSKVIKEPADDIYSLVNGIRNQEQFSFSSPVLFKNICDYITDNYGEGETRGYRFMIMPDDNDLVCTCPACVALGNTSDNATPAVTNLIRKLANRFPRHMFFTTGYRTTSEPPAERLPDNAGVFISTISLPKGMELDYNKPSVQAFSRQLGSWKEKTSNIYLWDYAANFDDYLTPLPIIYGLRKQLVFFQGQGIKGIFLNASGYDYSSFEDVKTFLAGALMMNTQINIDSLCKKYFEKKYPVSHKLLSEYYLFTEHQSESRNRAYDMYGGINRIVDSYLNVDRFIHFYDSLKIIAEKTEEEESVKLQKLLTALTFTRLQVAYVKNDKLWGAVSKVDQQIDVKPEINEYIACLEEYNRSQRLVNYKEADGKIDDYIAEWKQIASMKTFKNALIGIPVEILSGSGENEDTNMLNNGMPGFAQDYHQGWYLSNANDIHISLPVENLRNCALIKLRFLQMEKHNIYPPEKIKLIVDNKEIVFDKSQYMKRNGAVVDCVIPVDFSKIKNIELKFICRQVSKSNIGCDEIVIN